MRNISTVFAFASCALLIVLLHGCGGPHTTTITTTTSAKPATTKTTSTSTSASTVKPTRPHTTTTAKGTKPATIKTTSTSTSASTVKPTPNPTPEWNAADVLQNEYLDGKIGNVIWFPDDASKTFAENLKCTPDTHSKCVGKVDYADCAMEASVFNKFMNVDENNNFLPVHLQKVGYVFNTTVVATELNRCSYMWVAGIQGRLNRGCGNGFGPILGLCNDRFSAYKNQCPSTGKTCNADCPEVRSEICKDLGGPAIRPFPNTPTDIQCVIPGPAMNFTALPLVPLHKNDLNLERMVAERKKRSTDDLRSESNSVVIDEELLWEKLKSNPKTVLAIIHAIGIESPDIFESQAIKLRDDFCRNFGDSKKECVPLVQFNPTIDVTKERVYTGGAHSRKIVV